MLAARNDSGYNIARMRYAIIFAPEAAEDLRNLKANTRAIVCDAIEQFLRHQPAKISKARIKRLRGLSRPQYRLRVEDVRIFYDVLENRVEVLAIVPKSEAEDWLNQTGESDEEDRAI
jgi:mRNA interferase RelE/StbE